MPQATLNNARELLNAAADYLQRGWSVLPLRGDYEPGREKAPGIHWQHLQKQHATREQISDWFSRPQNRALGIVCGQISGLVVLDLDNQQSYHQLTTKFPELTQTYTVRTRRGYHLYYHSEQKLGTRKMRGADFKAEGSYVVAPPSTLRGHTYHVHRDLPLRAIVVSEIDALHKFLGGYDAKHQRNEQNAKRRYEQVSIDAASYVRLAEQNGRNEALYRLSLQARRQGYSYEQTVAILAEAHVLQPAQHEHRPETPEQRLREALTTIRSAYKRPLLDDDHKGLPNSIRERLLQLGLTSLARVLDALRSQWPPGQRFNRHDAVVVCQQAGVPLTTLRTALESHYCPANDPHHPQESGRPFRPLIKPVGRGAKSAKNPGRGRPTTYYELPSNERLAEILDVTISRSDRLPPSALRSARAYRTALHKALITRRPGQYGREWLAARLGVSRWTVRRYNRALKIQVKPVYGLQMLSPENISLVLPGADEPEAARKGRFLLDDRGRRYPPQRELAQKLLLSARLKGPLRYAVQQANDYAPFVGENQGENQPAVTPRYVHFPGPAAPRPTIPTFQFDEQGHPILPLRFESVTLTSYDDVRELIPPDHFNDAYHHWLETPDGRKYPVMVGLAFRLVKKHGFGEVRYIKEDTCEHTLVELGLDLLRLGTYKAAQSVFRVWKHNYGEASPAAKPDCSLNRRLL